MTNLTSRRQQGGFVLQVLLAVLGTAAFLISLGYSAIKNGSEYSNALRVAGDPDATPEEINSAAQGLQQAMRDGVRAGAGPAYGLGGYVAQVGPDALDAMEQVRNQQYVIKITPSPADPAPNQAVSVTVNVINSVTGTAVTYSVAGTDGYSASGSPATDAGGSISFTIPGGAQGVTDTITVTVGPVTETYTYTF